MCAILLYSATYSSHYISVFSHKAWLAIYETRLSVMGEAVANIALHNEAEMKNTVALHRTWLSGLITTSVEIHIVRIQEGNSNYCDLDGCNRDLTCTMMKGVAPQITMMTAS